MVRSPRHQARTAICAALPFPWGAKRWSLRLGTSLGVGNDARSTPTTTFETFPFPKVLTPNIPAAHYASDPPAQPIAVAAKKLDDLRRACLNPPDPVDIVADAAPTAAPGEAPRRDLRGVGRRALDDRRRCGAGELGVLWREPFSQ